MLQKRYDISKDTEHEVWTPRISPAFPVFKDLGSCRRTRLESAYVGWYTWNFKQYRVFPGGSDSKESACNARNLGLIPGLGRFPGEGYWRRAWQPTLVSCLENPHGQRSLAGYSSWGHKESDMTELRSTAPSFYIEPLLKYFKWSLLSLALMLGLITRDTV